MLNKSVMDINSAFVPFRLSDCYNGASLVLISGILSIFIFLVTPINCWMLWLYLRDGWKIKSTQVFLFNLTILELIFCLQCAIQMICILTGNSGSLWRLPFIVFGLVWVGRPLIQICICVERYLAVIHPVKFLKYKGLQYRIVCVAFVWMMAAGYSVYESFTDIFPDAIFNCVFLIAVIVISFCCLSLLRALRHPGPGDTQISVERGRDVGNQQKRKAFNKIFRGLLIILFTFLPQLSLGVMNFLKIDKILFHCNIVPIMNSFIVGVVIHPLLKMYRHCRRKYFKNKTGIRES